MNVAKIWYEDGLADGFLYKEHPDQALQQFWNFLLKEVDGGEETWQTVFENFPHYKKGYLEATKQLKLL